MKDNINANEKKVLSRDKKRLLFYSVMMIFPVAQFAIFYIYMNFTAFKLSFEEYDMAYNVTYTFNNFKTIFEFLSLDTSIKMLTNSLLFFVFNLIVGSVAALFFSFYIFKKCAFAEFFRVILFLPQIISAMVLALLFKYIATDVYMEVFNKELGLLGNPDTMLTTIIIYNLWMGFGTNILMYSSAMSGVNDSIIESSHLDGVNSLQEFWYIVFPMIYSTFVTFTIVSVAGIFTNSMHLYTIYLDKAIPEIRTFGYFIFAETRQPSNGLISGNPWTLEAGGILNYCQLSALGMLITLVMVPTTMLIRKLMEKFGPSTD